MGSKIPAIVRSVVVLPAPLAPKSDGTIPRNDLRDRLTCQATGRENRFYQILRNEAVRRQCGSIENRRDRQSQKQALLRAREDDMSRREKAGVRPSFRCRPPPSIDGCPG